MSEWDKVLAATERHNIHSIDVHLDTSGRSRTYIQCTCNQTFTEEWEFTDHVRRLVYDVLRKQPE